MSLHQLANHMAAQGRGPDTTLVHMSPREVAGLQQLAMAHGGSLTTNPQTGLPEAGVLDKLLPTILGFGAVAMGIPAGYAALGIGGLEAVRSGDLRKGLMAGLGAYGGANMASGLIGAGEGAIAGKALEGKAQDDLIARQIAQKEAVANASIFDKLSAGAGAGIDAFKAATRAGIPGGALGVAGMAAAPLLADKLIPTKTEMPATSTTVKPYAFDRKPLIPADAVTASYMPGQSTRERMWFEDKWTPGTPYTYTGTQYMASGGPIEQMSDAVSVGANTGFPMADIQRGGYATPWQTPISRNVVADESDTGVDSFTGAPRGMAAGGLGSLGGYSDGGRMLKGPGDGMSDSIPATIGGKRPARLADGEFVVPADVVSHLGNGSTDAGARQLYKMMDRIRQQRTGKKKQAPQVNPTKAMPA